MAPIYHRSWQMVLGGRVGRYEILREIGRGGTAAVYLAR